MAKNTAPKTGKNGIDRWTSNGYGLNITSVPITKDQAKQIDKETDNKKGKNK